jgi:hypothetical protein
VFLTFERVHDHKPPTWPEDVVPKQLHLDLAVVDLDAKRRGSLLAVPLRLKLSPVPISGEF